MQAGTSLRSSGSVLACRLRQGQALCSVFALGKHGKSAGVYYLSSCSRVSMSHLGWHSGLLEFSSPVQITISSHGASDSAGAAGFQNYSLVPGPKVLRSYET